MPFGVLSGVGLGMGVLDFGGDRQRRRGSLGGEFAVSHCNQEEFVESLCGSAYSDRAVVWRGEWGVPRHSCVRWKSSCLKGNGAVSGMVSGIFRKFNRRPIVNNALTSPQSNSRRARRSCRTIQHSPHWLQTDLQTDRHAH